ncbi:MAG: type II secretion system protein [Phycisphaerae bacterium]|nr:type II secretion system protein [Phycisphaerae bacterium]
MRNSNRHISCQHFAACGRRGFTLIELLVVIAVIALLMGILLPTLASARRTAQAAKELVGVKQLGTAYTLYAQDNKSALLPGYLRGSWARADRRKFMVYDNPNNASEESRLTGSVIRPYPWRLMPYMNYAYPSVIVDKALLATAQSASDGKKDGRAFHRVMARHPSFGLNSTYVGGDAHRGAYYAPSLARWGAFYVTRLDQVIFPSRLMVFASSRGVLRDSGGQKVPGYHRLDGPWRATPTSNSVPAFVKWNAPSRFDADLPTTTYGHLDFRHDGKTVAVSFDTHAERLSLEQMGDMTRWANKATDRDWHPR